MATKSCVIIRAGRHNLSLADLELNPIAAEDEIRTRAGGLGEEVSVSQLRNLTNFIKRSKRLSCSDGFGDEQLASLDGFGTLPPSSRPHSH